MRPIVASARRAATEGGFTLVEVMAAVAILALALTVISESQQAGMRHVIRAKKMTIASLLAREKMADLEDELAKDGFPEFDKDDEGEFEDGFEGYTYSWKIEKIELPSSLDPDAMTDALTGEGQEGGGGTSESSTSGMAAFGGQMLTQQFELFRNILEQSIRRITLKVGWKEGRADKSISVTLYVTDPRRIGSAIAPGTTSTGQTSGATGQGTTTTGQGTTATPSGGIR